MDDPASVHTAVAQHDALMNSAALVFRMNQPATWVCLVIANEKRLLPLPFSLSVNVFSFILYPA